jgi:putative endonuclease
MKAAIHYIYVLQCSDDTFYCGYTTDVARRLLEHNGESKIAGARYTSGRRPVQVIHQESFSTRSEALKREVVIKKLSKSAKRVLMAKGEDKRKEKKKPKKDPVPK